MKSEYFLFINLMKFNNIGIKVFTSEDLLPANIDKIALFLPINWFKSNFVLSSSSRSGCPPNSQLTCLLFQNIFSQNLNNNKICL